MHGLSGHQVRYSPSVDRFLNMKTVAHARGAFTSDIFTLSAVIGMALDRMSLFLIHYLYPEKDCGSVETPMTAQNRLPFNRGYQKKGGLPEGKKGRRRFLVRLKTEGSTS